MEHSRRRDTGRYQIRSRTPSSQHIISGCCCLPISSVLSNKSKASRPHEPFCIEKVYGGGCLERGSRRTSQHPPVQIPQPPGKALQEILPVCRSRLTLVRRNGAVVRNQLFLQRPSCSRLRFSGTSTLFLQVDDRATLHPRGTWCLLT